VEAGSQRDLLPVLGQPPLAPLSRSRLRGIALHFLRLGVIVAIVWLIHLQHRSFIHQQSSRQESDIEIEWLRDFYPNAASISGDPAVRDAREVLATDGRSLGYFVQTSPQSDPIVGYSGPTNTLIAFDAEGRVIGITVIESRDTPEHVSDVALDERFMTALRGKTRDDAGAATEVDAVSGATLTSLAILEGINFRLGGNKPSLKFPNEIELPEVIEFFPNAQSLRPRASSGTVVEVYGSNDAVIGAVARTSPATDSMMGYQGPTDTLVAFDEQDRVIGLQIRKSYDNEPYVGYVRDEAYFRERFNGLTLQELAKIDIDALQVEGVSGATMTSMAIAGGLSKAAQAALEPPPTATRRFVFATRDVGTLLALAAAIVISFSRLRGYRRVRVAFDLMLVVYFGFMNGDMLSQALLVGWAQSGVPWRLAPGLMLLVAASLIIPAASKKQIYCHRICPFGAAQRLIRNRLPWKVRLLQRSTKWRKATSTILLILVVLTAMLHWPLNLALIEPFDAFFLLRVAASLSLVIAIGGLIDSAFVPMAYCRFSCPTGALLNHLRYNARSDRLTRRDAIAVALLLLAAVIYVTS